MSRLAVLAVSLLALSPGCRTAPTSPSPPATRVFEGTLVREGHFSHPFETRTTRVRLSVARPTLETMELAWTAWEQPDGSDAEHMTCWVRGDAVVRREGDGPARAVGGMDAAALRFCARALLEPERAQVTPLAHPRLGDVDNRATPSRDGERATLTLDVSPRDERWTLSVTSRPARGDDEAPAAWPREVTPLPERAAARVVTIAEGVHSIELTDEDARTVVVEGEDGLTVLEAPLDSDVGERLVDAIHARFPGRRIARVLVGHYHPHYTGGVRAFLAEGATVVATPATARLVRWLADRPFTRAPDRFAREASPVQLEELAHTRSFGGGATRVVAIDVGEASQHTSEYVVFSLPAARLLIEGDLGWYGVASGAIRASRRAKGLVAAVERAGLDVETVFQMWPVRDQQPSLSIGALRALIAR